MSRFSNQDKTRKIDLGEGDWVKIPEVISFDTAAKMAKTEGDATKVIMSAVVGWNLKDDGQPVEFAEDNVRRLDIQTVTAIVQEIGKAVTLPKAEKPE